MATKQHYFVEYVWADVNNVIRGKTKVFQKPINDLSDLGYWWFDGSSTGQAEGYKSDVFLSPVRLYNDPFRKGHKLALCETFDDALLTKPNFANKRHEFAALHDKFSSEEVWIGIEQEYIIMDRHTNLPYKWKGDNDPGCGPQGPYYCGTGGNKMFGRELVEEHMVKCLEAGVSIFGINAEVAPSQWEFQVGTGDALEISDDLMIARYILDRLTESKELYITIHPKPLKGDWNGSGAHTNFSTKAMRSDGGLEVILKALERMGKNHAEDVKFYGEDNHLRLTGKHETSSMSKFSWDFGDRGKSVRIAPSVKKDGKGYFEDRRPASNMNPYIVLTRLYKTLFEERNGASLD